MVKILDTIGNNIRILFRGLQAGYVLKMDERHHRDPMVAERLKYLKAQGDFTQMMLSNPSLKKKMDPAIEQQMKYMPLAMQRLEQALKKQPTLKMSELQSLSSNQGQLQQTRVRTRPGPPTRGKGRY